MNDKLFTQLDEFISTQRPEIEKTLSALISIPSVTVLASDGFPYGAVCAHAVDTALAIGEEMGLERENVDYRACSLLYKSGNDDKEVGIVCHIDVVPAGDGWNNEPFALTVQDDLYIGRGTRDDKGAAVAAMYTMKFLKQQKVSLPFSVRLIMGSDEEKGMSDLPYYLEKKKPPFFSFTPDSEYPVCIGEKGIMGAELILCSVGGSILSIEGGNADNSVCDSVKATVRCSSPAPADGITLSDNGDGTFEITALGKTSHAAYPEKSHNAIGILAAYLTTLFEPNTREYNAFVLLKDILCSYKGEALGIKMEDRESGYLTCIGGRIFVRDGKIIQNINIRYPVTRTAGDVFPNIGKTVADAGFTAVMLYDKKPYYFNPETDNIKALTDAYTQVTGDTNTTYTTGGGTYARAFPNTVAFGVSLPGTEGRLGEMRGNPHERDEYLTREEMETSIKIFTRAILNLAKVNA